MFKRILRPSAVLLAVLVVLFAQASPSVLAAPMDFTRLVADIDDRDPGTTGRTPLILVHGLDGTDGETFNGVNGASQAEKVAFHFLLDWAYDNGLTDDFQIFRFHYLSNVMPISDVAQGFREWVDQLTASGDLPDGQFMIVAHSMGGLVSREFLAHQTLEQGEYAGKKAHERLARLITLGSPHHGSPAANDTARHIDDIDYDQLIQLIDEYYWGDVAVTDPNRSDLRWDNFQALPSDPPGYDDATEYNAWLAALNAEPASYDKLVAYVGSTSGDAYPLHELRDYLIDSTASYFAGLYATCQLSGFLPSHDDNPVLYPYRGPYDDRKDFTVNVQYCFLSVLLGKMTLLDNDALVPEPSASLEGLVRDSYVRRFPGYDHEYLKSGMPGTDELFVTLAEDLRGAIPPDDPGAGDSTDWNGDGGGCVLDPAHGGDAGLLLPLLAGLGLLLWRRRDTA